MAIIIYFNDIAIYENTQEQVLEDILEAINWLGSAGSMLNLYKAQLVQAAATALRHLWISGSFWVPHVTKLTDLMEKTYSELAWVNWASLYGLLDFSKAYVPAFAKLVEPLCLLLGQYT